MGSARFFEDFFLKSFSLVRMTTASHLIPFVPDFICVSCGDFTFVSFQIPVYRVGLFSSTRMSGTRNPLDLNSTSFDPDLYLRRVLKVSCSLKL